jgi:hypothetical protein
MPGAIPNLKDMPIEQLFCVPDDGFIVHALDDFGRCRDVFIFVDKIDAITGHGLALRLTGESATELSATDA